jgi:Domain of unknown function (DUF4389)
VTLASSISPTTSSPVEVAFGSPARQRRITIFFRLLFVIPQLIVLFFVGIAAYVLLVFGWFGALITSRLPEGIATFLVGYLRWSTRLIAYEYLLTDKYPPFTLGPSSDYPIDLDVRTGRLNRWAVLFRYFLSIPGFIAVSLLTYGMQIFGIVNWLVTLVKGEQPPVFFGAYAASIRYYTRMIGYFFMLTSVYPAQVLGDDPSSMLSADPTNVPSPGLPSFEEAYGPSTTQSPVPPPVSTPDLTTTTPIYAPAPGSTPPGVPVPGLVAPPPFDVPPPYPPPAPGFSSVPADQTWNLVLSSGARKLVVVFFILGAVGIIGYTTFFIALSNRATTSDQAITAQNQVVSGYNAALVAVQSFSTAAKTCNQSSSAATAQVACLEANDAKLATAFDNYASALSVIDFPSSASSAASAAQSAASQAGSTMHQLAGAGADPQAYQAAVTSSNVQSVFTQVDTTFKRLNSVLING